MGKSPNWYARKLETDRAYKRRRRARMPRCRFPGCERYWKLYEHGGCFEHEKLYVDHDRIVTQIRAIPCR